MCYFIVNFYSSSRIFRIFQIKNREQQYIHSDRLKYWLWLWLCYELTAFADFYIVAMLCVSVWVHVYHLSFSLCVYANEWLFVGVFSCLFFSKWYEFSCCALLIVFTDFASLILHSIQFWSMHFMWLRFFFSFPHSSSSAYKYVCVFCSFSSARTHFFACSDILLYFSSLRVSDSAFWAAVFIFSCM